jgi:hypothetical protein
MSTVIDVAISKQSDINAIPTGSTTTKGAAQAYVGPGNGYGGTAWSPVNPGVDARALASDSSQPTKIAYNVSTGGVLDNAVDLTHLTRLARPRGIAWAPSGWIASTCSRSADGLSAGAGTTASGKVTLSGGAVIPRGQTVSNVNVIAANTIATLTHQWACLVDQSGNVLAKSSDLLTATWTSGATITFSLTAGSGAYTPGSDAPVYIGLMMVYSPSPPSLVGISLATGLDVVPMVCATAGAGLTTPASLGATVGALTATSGFGFAWLT